MFAKSSYLINCWAGPVQICFRRPCTCMVQPRARNSQKSCTRLYNLWNLVKIVDCKSSVEISRRLYKIVKSFRSLSPTYRYAYGRSKSFGPYVHGLPKKPGIHYAPIIVTPHPPQVGQRWGFARVIWLIPHPWGRFHATNPLLFPWCEVGKCRKLNRKNFVRIEVWNTGEKIVTSLVLVHLKLWVPSKLEAAGITKLRYSK